jgi:ABC-type antimicrobial peptide transport system permease subunit
VIWLVMREVLLLVAIGLVVGVPSALVLGRFVSTQLYGIHGTDPVIAAAMILLLSVVAGAAGMIPAHRASRIEPMAARRFE